MVEAVAANAHWKIQCVKPSTTHGVLSLDWTETSEARKKSVPPRKPPPLSLPNAKAYPMDQKAMPPMAACERSEWGEWGGWGEWGEWGASGASGERGERVERKRAREKKRTTKEV